MARFARPTARAFLIRTNFCSIGETEAELRASRDDSLFFLSGFRDVVGAFGFNRAVLAGLSRCRAIVLIWGGDLGNFGNFDPRDAFMCDADLFCRALRQIKTAARDERAAIVDSHVHGFAVLRIRDFDH